MIQGLPSSGAGALPQNEPHDEFLDLCAASTTGDLSDDEKKRLHDHLGVCSSCREVLQQYQSVIDAVLPAVAVNEGAEDVRVDTNWSQDKAEKALFERLVRDEKQTDGSISSRNGSPFFPHRVLPFSGESTWRNVWALYAAGILLFCALSFFAYRVGMHRGSEVANIPKPLVTHPEVSSAQTALEEQLSDAGHDREVATAEIAKRDKLIAELRSEMQRQSAEINNLRTAQTRLESNLQADDASKQEVSRQKAELEQKLKFAENGSQALQQKLDQLVQQSATDDARTKASDATVADLTRQLQEQQAAVGQRDEMLLHDRDIREVMGARDLYIAEIYDVAGTGETKKPYGRVFYTRGKSLIFYAYDLDQQAELKPAGEFQAWGRRGPDRQQAINLGVFYEDNATRKRWILKCDDPRTLTQIDAVFVTVEPKGGSHKPSSKTLLFASLKIDPNHP
jgi:hypothetical protein